MSSSPLNIIFKAYDVRGIYPEQLDETTARRIGEAYANINKPGKVAVGRDVRASGENLKEQLIDGLTASGVDVADLGVITTDQLYFAVGNYGLHGGISVTASHNPREYNGFKFSERGGAPITSEGLLALRDWIAKDSKPETVNSGQVAKLEILDDYINHVLTYIDKAQIKQLSLVVNANFGAVGRGVDKLAGILSLKLERLNWQEDGSFPKGPPNPLLPQNRDETARIIKRVKPDFGVAWDADADRCFFFTGDGTFIPSCYIIALLAREFIKKQPGAKIVHDLTTKWVIEDAVNEAGGHAISNRSGHTFIKARMRQEDAVFAGESSGHYYFKSSFYADNGIVPFLMILELISTTGKTLAELVGPLMEDYKVSGEVNFTVDDASKVTAALEKKFGNLGTVDKTDGLVIENDNWRFSVRSSNTEPLLRLNAEARSQTDLDKLVKELTGLISAPV